ncbi:MAG: hypothetical protein PF484_01625 [Bacteroidales bacterium]|jgi:hypothetical protein|nr:hypothetical protein [Bacteroidales bacterium]
MTSKFKIKKYLYLLLLIGGFFFANSIKAQFYAGGQSPGSIKWKQINSPYFQVIFPEGFESQANYTANVLEYARVLDGKTLNNNPPKISVILHNRTVESNAEVGWAPRRIEFFTQPPQDTYAQEWFQQLALHEYRHVVQIDKMHQGLTKILYALFGQQITAGIYGLYVPWWFIEGDAVVTETALSKSGRGRQAFFEMELRTQLLQKGAFSYDKAAHGSYKEFTTTHYHLGYYLVGYGRAKYGAELWSNALDNVGRKPYSITPFSDGIKNHIGLNKEKFYKSAIYDLDSIWKQQDKQIEKTSFRFLTQSSSYINYLNPSTISDNQVIAIKKDFEDVGHIVLIDESGEEQKVITPGKYFPETLSIKNGLVCWAEYEYDPRWTYRSFTKIYTYSLDTKEKKRITSKQRYFAPALNNDATRIVVSESTVNYEHSLAIIELIGGQKERVYTTESNDFLSYPAWSDDSKKLIAVSLNENGKSLIEFDVSTANYKYLLPFEETNISKPIYWNEYVLFQGDYSGISNIYALHLASNTIFQVTSSAYGAHSPQVWKDQLLYSEYTANGNQIAVAQINILLWKPLGEIENTNYPLADILHQQEDTLLISESIPQTKYEIKKYSKLGNLINPHSWGPFSVSMENYGFNPGVSVSSQNKLSTFFLSLGYEHDLNNQEGTYFAEATYLGWFPALNLRADYGYKERNVHDAERDSSFKMGYNETNFRTSVYVPLFFTSGNWYQRIQPRIDLEYKQLDVVDTDVELQRTNYKILDYFISFSNYQRSAKQSVYPKWGQHISLAYKQTPFDNSGKLFAFSSLLYFPGLIKHQGLRLYLAYQKRIGDADFYNDQIAYARGYSGLSFEKVFSYKVDYKLPLAYPDFNWGSLIYLKRITLAVFYDEVKGNGEEKDQYRSVGNDLLFEVHFLRSFVPFEIGIRSIYLIDDNSPYFGFLSSIKL